MPKWEMVKLGDVAKLYQPQTISQADFVENAEFNVFGANGVIGKYTQYNHKNSEIVVTCRGATCGNVHITPPKCWITGNAMVILPKTTSEVYQLFLFFALCGVSLSLAITGAAQPQITRANLEKIKIPLPPLEEQKKIAQELDSIQSLIAKRKEQLEKMDLLAKAKFVEMFGDPVANPMGWDIVQLGKICTKITDGKHGGCAKVEDSGYYFVGAREIFNNKVNYDTAPQIPESEFKKDYKRCNIENDDFIIVNTGATIGKSAVLNHELTTKTLLQKSVALIKAKKHILSTIYLKFCYALNTKLYHVAGASAQPNLLLSQIRETCIPLPPIDLQNKFADYIQQTETLKTTMHSGLEKLELLYSSKMQEYFG